LPNKHPFLGKPHPITPPITAIGEPKFVLPLGKPSGSFGGLLAGKRWATPAWVLEAFLISGADSRFSSCFQTNPKRWFSKNGN
jgi:hypothetical protein